jgi:hypothetical protein
MSQHSTEAIPERPDVPKEQIGSAEHELRYDDLCQDGRMRIGGVWAPMGRILWTKMPVARTLARLGAGGVRNVLSFVMMQADDVPLSIRGFAESEVRYRLGHTTGVDGQPNRIVFETWLSTRAAPGRLGDPTARPSGEPVLAARAFGQHVFTRPSAPPGQHRVLRLEDPSFPELPAERVEFFDPKRILALPVGAEPLEPGPRAEEAPIVFGLVHTDGNQHVNFMVYPRLTEDAALRRLDELGFRGQLLGRRAEVGYRKPCFAGDRMRLVLQAFRLHEKLGVVAALVPDEAPAQGASSADPWSAFGRSHCMVRLLLSH